MGERTTRRDLLRTAGVTGAVVSLPTAALAQAPQRSVPNNIIPARPPRDQATPTPGFGQGAPARFFLTEPEALFLFAAAARLIPGDAASPSAAEAGFVDFIDRQLAGSYGGGERLYLQGPWKPGTSRQGYQLRYTPRELYRTALAALDGLTRGRFGNRSFEALDAEEQDNLLGELEAARHDLGGVPSAVFFETLLANVIESYFADPVYGGNQGGAGWRLVGFPGAYASFIQFVDQHGVAFEREPMGMAELPHMHDDHG
jgi:gluconate 2-dehydrogenase gamma chain